MPLSCTSYFCTSGDPKQKTDRCIRRPLESPGLAPYVRMKFPNMLGLASAVGAVVGAVGIQNPGVITIDTGAKPDLTVGNQSNPPNNHAIIKSFQYGSSDGSGAEVEIYDEEGGEFDLFVNKIVKVLDDANSFGCSVEWGWITSDCNGNEQLGPHSSLHYFLILSVDIHYAAGGITFKLELQDLMEPLFETRTNDVFGGMTLKDAIRELFENRANPRIPSVLFKRVTPGAGGTNPCNNLQTNPIGALSSNPASLGKLQDFKFKGDLETRAPDAPWECKNQTPLAAVRDWLRDKMTDRDKGTIIFWNSCSPKPELIILEDPLPKCWSDLASEQCSRSIGTYLVNGSNNSPVLSFDPQIKFNFATAARAGAGQDTETTEGERTQPEKPCPEDAPNKNPVGSGDTTYVQMTEPFNQIYGPGNIALAIRGVAANERANKTYQNIEAELRIQGDPTLDNPYTLMAKTVSLVVVNPFHLRDSGGNQIISGSFGACPEWLVGPPCNQILSNKNWFISGVSHEIKEGSFTTTLKIYLLAPGQTLMR